MAKFTIDPVHSNITFKVRHLMISNVNGAFKSFSGTLETDDDATLTNTKAHFEAAIDSIETGNTDRDGHLKSGDFFDAAAFPILSFDATSINLDGTDISIDGNLTIKGVTKLVTLKGEYNGSVTDAYGQYKIGFDLNTKISRKDFGLTWNGITEAGKIVVSDEVRIGLELQYTKEA